jgi:hypothetical protein
MSPPPDSFLLLAVAAIAGFAAVILIGEGFADASRRRPHPRPRSRRFPWERF